VEALLEGHCFSLVTLGFILSLFNTHCNYYFELLPKKNPQKIILRVLLQENLKIAAISALVSSCIRSFYT